MRLKSLHIHLNSSYEPDPGKYKANIRWEGKDGETAVTLDPDVSERLLAFIGPVIVEFSHRAATQIANNIQFSVEEARKSPQIELTSNSEYTCEQLPIDPR